VFVVIYTWGIYGGIVSSIVLVLFFLLVFLHPVTRNATYNLFFRRFVYDYATGVYIFPDLGFRPSYDTHPMGQPTNMGPGPIFGGGNMGGVFVAPRSQEGPGH
jgi:hypothetical protein